MSDSFKAAQGWLRECVNANHIVIRSVNGEVEFEYIVELARNRTCATCRWAEPNVVDEADAEDIDRQARAVAAFPLTCRAASKGYDEPYSRKAQGTLFVAPTFGCVQWEERDQSRDQERHAAEMPREGRE